MSYNLENVENYSLTYDTNDKEMFSRYMQVVAEFCGQAEESVKVSNLDYFNYVVVRGLETITHVYRMLLLYTRNVDLSFYNCKKSLYYYLEFIGQIGDESHEFLKLTSTDAALFVYKKTIFALNHNFRKEYVESAADPEKIITDNLFNLTELFLTAFKNRISAIVNEERHQLGNLLKITSDYAAVLASYTCEKKNYNYKLSCMLKISDTIIANKIGNMELLMAISRKLGRSDIDYEKISEVISRTKDQQKDMTARRYSNLLFIECAKNITDENIMV